MPQAILFFIRNQNTAIASDRSNATAIIVRDKILNYIFFESLLNALPSNINVCRQTAAEGRLSSETIYQQTGERPTIYPYHFGQFCCCCQGCGCRQVSHPSGLTQEGQSAFRVVQLLSVEPTVLCMGGLFPRVSGLHVQLLLC